MVDPRLLERKLASLLNAVGRTRQKRGSDRATFLADADARDLVSFNLLIAFQDALDIAAHVIADEGWELPATAREHFDILARHGFLDPALADALGKGAAARNLIAHAYGSVDFGRLFDEIPAGLAALEQFAARCEGASRP